jgi:rod shape determining protein RodA
VFVSSFNERQPSVDWLMMIAAIGLMTIGVFFIVSAKWPEEAASALAWHSKCFFKQAVWCGLGVAIGAILCLIDYRMQSRWSVVLYWTMIFFLILVIIPGIGSKRFGARRWIDLGPIQFQPSEFAKLALVFAQANFLSRPREELRQLRLFWKSLGMTALPFALILIEPDLGSALVLFPVTFGMMFVAGVPPVYLRNLILGVTAVIVLLLVDVLFAPAQLRLPLEDYQRRRLMVYFGRDYAPENAEPEVRQRLRRQQLDDSHNIRQALISVGSGGLTGVGWRQSEQIRLGFLPRAVAHNDFIFSVIAEEKGFLGSVTVLTLYTVVLFTGLRAAGQARDRLGKMLAVGVVMLLFSHIFINIGMNIRLMPVTGIPLPLLSYGGSSVLCSLVAISLLQNVYLYRKS